MMIEKLVSHAMTANATANLFLFQIATLKRLNECLVWERWPWLGRMERDVHAKNNQERSAELAHVGNGLENIAKSLPPKGQKITHNLEHDHDLRTVSSQEKRVSVGKRIRGWDAPDNSLES
jgi:hypothetical protein